MRAKLFLRSSFFRSVETIVSIISGFIMLPFMIRTLGNDLYGLWIIIASLTTSLYIFDLGMAQSVTRFISLSLGQKNYPKATEILSTAFMIYLGLGLLVLLATVAISLLAPLLVEQSERETLVQILVLIVGLNVAIGFPFKCYAGIASYHLRQDLLSYSRITFKVISTVAVLYLLYIGYGLITVALVQLTTSFLSDLVFRFIARYLEPDLKISLRTVSRLSVKEIASFSVWTFGMDMTRLLKERGDVWVVAALTSPAILTVYYVGVRLVEYLTRLVISAVGITMPFYIRAIAEEDDAALKKSAKLFIRLNAFLGVFLLGGAIIFGQSVIRLWMGNDFDYHTAYLVLVTLLAGKLTAFISNPVSSILFALGKNRYQTGIGIIEAISSFLLIYIFIIKLGWGIQGAALGIAAPFLITRLVLMPYFLAKHSIISQLYFYRTSGLALIPGLLVSITFGAALHLWSEWSLNFLELVGAIVVYSALYLLAHLIVLDDEERQIIKKLINPKTATTSKI